MLRRNWLDLGRKLVDRFDLDFTINAIEDKFKQEALAFFGSGVLISNAYPDPFPVALSGTDFTGTVGRGIAYDLNGQIMRNDTPSINFTLSTPDATNARWDLVVLRYKQVGQLPIPKPSDPILTVNLNLVDGFDVIVIPGTASATPSYPVKGTFDVILAGVQVPAGATFANQATIDLSVREKSFIDGGSF